MVAVCKGHQRHWFAGQPTCQRCGVPKGRLEQALRFVGILASYDCAGLDDNDYRCGQCGPCEAAAFLAARRGNR